MVLFASYSGALGGAERLLLDWAPAIDAEVCLACPEGALADAARARGLRVLRLRRRSLRLRGSLRDRVLAPWSLAGHGRELRRLARTLDPELVVAWGMRSALACLLGPGRLGRASGGPPVAFQHNDFLPGPAVGYLVRAAAARAEIVTVPSHAVARDIDPAGRIADRLKLVYPGVDVERFDADCQPGQPPEVLVLGALAEWKRPDLALEACARARVRNPELRVRLVGAPLDDAGERFLASLRARAAEPDLQGAVEFEGPVADPAAILARGTCLLHCAEREPFGLAVLEALAAGRPAVVPASAGPAEIVDDSCGFLYPPGDAGAAAIALTRVLADPELAARMGAAGRSRAREQFGLALGRERWAEAIGRPAPAPAAERPGPARATDRPAPASLAERPAPASLQIVTVTRNSEAAIGNLLASVERHLPEVTVVVVDCASSDQTVALAGSSRVARLTALDQNVGFGRACNRGIAGVSATVTALLNPDVELLDESLLSLCAEALRSDSRLLAPLVLRGDGSREDSVHPIPGSPAELLRAVLPFTLLPGRMAAPLAPWRASQPRRVGWAVGCALVARTETLVRLGPFDERIFLYGEDLELGLRAAEAGIETWFCPSGRVLHHGAHATGPEFDGEPFDLLAHNRREVIAQRLGRRRVAVDDAAQALTFASRIVAKQALARPAIRERRQLQALVRVRREGR